MRFGIRECTNIVFRAKTNMAIGTTKFKAGQPVLYIDSAKTSTLEGSGTTVYATGGRGNTNLIAWEGEKTLTFTMEDALISPLGMAILSGAGLIKHEDAGPVHVHKTVLQTVKGNAPTYSYFFGDTTAGKYLVFSGITNRRALRAHINDIVVNSSALSGVDAAVKSWITSLDTYIDGDSTKAIDFFVNSIVTYNSTDTGAPSGDNSTTYTTALPRLVEVKTPGTNLTVDVSSSILSGEELCDEAPLYVIKVDADNSLTNEIANVTSATSTGEIAITQDASAPEAGDNVVVDFYVTSTKTNTNEVSEIQIDAEHFAGYFYVEADTLFRRQIDGKDCPAIITLPNVKIQSNFTFTMASSGDPSTFTFTMDAMPGYTYFNKKKKVLCVVQMINNTTSEESEWDTVMPHTGTGADHIARHEDQTNGYADGVFYDSIISENPSN